MQKTLVIENRRLGMLFRFLQISCLVVVAYNTFAQRVWIETHVPVDNGLEVWTSAGNATLKGNSNVAHCNDASSMDYKYDASYDFKFNGCDVAPLGETVTKSGIAVFFATMHHDNFHWIGSGTSECSTLKTSCQGMSGSWTENGAGTECACEKKKTGFFKNAEETVLHVSHGYEVSLGDKTIRGKDKFPGQTTGNQRHWKELSGNGGKILTVVQKADGTKCKIGAGSAGGAKSEWKPEEMGDGLSGSIKEWLACADITLDATQNQLKSGLAIESGSPTARIAGLGLRLDMVYYNKDSAYYEENSDYGVVCYVKVIAQPKWNSKYSMAYSTVPDPNTGDGSYRFRILFGTSVDIVTKGSFAVFNHTALVTGIVNALVLLSLPGLIIQFVALSLIGPVSKIYKRSQSEVLSISKHFLGLSSRMLGNVRSFSGLAGKDKKLSLDELKKALKEALNAHLKSGTLSDEEFNLLATELQAGMADETGTVTVDSYVNAAASNEALTPAEMVLFFDKERKRGILEKLLADPRTNKAAALTQVLPTEENEETEAKDS